MVWSSFKTKITHIFRILYTYTSLEIFINDFYFIKNLFTILFALILLSLFI